MVQYGPASTRVMSMTVSPASGPSTAADSVMARRVSRLWMGGRGETT